MRRNLISIITLCAALWASAQVCYSPPVKLAIDSQEAFDRWTTINFNENVTFEYSADNGAEIAQDKSSAMNNWLISPAVELEGGTSYKLKMYCKRISTFSSDKAAFTISAGTEATAEGQTSTIHSESSFQSSYFKDVEANFTPDASGVYYFGIHMTTQLFNGGFAIQYLDIQPVLPLP
ncbi:MAG: choice-of-anchor J domain-containing protein, partial [Muribaculaceae bacterium]|nr:choice-of-anchor J domain-containing protein [Muribaculaceae bacterium]